MAAAEEQLRLWEILMAMLDQTAAVLREKRLSSQRFAELLRLVMIAGDLSTIPQGLEMCIRDRNGTAECSTDEIRQYCWTDHEAKSPR